MLEVTDVWITTNSPSAYIDVVEVWLESSLTSSVCYLEISDVWIEATSTLNIPPIANAGPDQVVEPWSTVVLDGSDSNDAGGSAIATWAWTQVSGTGVVLAGSGNTRTFTAPGAIANSNLVFSLTVSDDTDASSPDTVTITVMPVTERAIIGGQEVPLRMTIVKL